MFSATQRLRRTSDIKHVYKAGRAAQIRPLRIIAVPTQLLTSRATVVVSTRVTKRATKRNRIKRRLRVDLRLVLQQLTTPHDLVVVAQPGAATVSSEQLTTALVQGCKKLNLI
jgi:ribonuclease P protein component